jgi:hypothetical protein
MNKCSNSSKLFILGDYKKGNRICSLADFDIAFVRFCSAYYEVHISKTLPLLLVYLPRC